MVRKNNSWGLAAAKAQLSEVVERAQHAPQIIERRGQPVGVVVGMKLHEEAERRATLGSVEQRMREFLEISAKIRAEGGVQPSIPRRAPRKSPFAR
jgi:prevent-host-death family protein